MYIIVVGGGKVGYYLAKELLAELGATPTIAEIDGAAEQAAAL